MRNYRFMLKVLVLALATAWLTPAALAGNGNGDGNAYGNQGARAEQKHGFPSGQPGSMRGLVHTDKHIYYPGDTLVVRVVYPVRVTPIWSGEVDSHVVVFTPAGEAISVPLPADVPDQPVNLIELSDLDTSNMAPGDYQLAVILTEPGGDPLLVGDWHEGFHGLLSVERIRFALPPDPEDEDEDGEFDDDQDGDGYEEEEQEGDE